MLPKADFREENVGLGCEGAIGSIVTDDTARAIEEEGEGGVDEECGGG